MPSRNTRPNAAAAFYHAQKHAFMDAH